mmetsp:Transcript_27603/g.43435  ORF Transcript_27603/g.43435 Transcript_27603/m.43435 type:complete len:260 (+) Transcript_27603:709-1488(+)
MGIPPTPVAFFGALFFTTGVLAGVLATGVLGFAGAEPPNRLKVPDPRGAGAGAEGAAGGALGAALGALAPKKLPKAGGLLFLGAGVGFGVSTTAFFVPAGAPPNKLNVPLPLGAAGLTAGAGVFATTFLGATFLGTAFLGAASPKENRPPAALGAGFGAGTGVGALGATGAFGAAGLDGLPKKLNEACLGFSAGTGAGTGAGGALATGVDGFDPKNELRASVMALGAISISSFFASTLGATGAAFGLTGAAFGFAAAGC